jgi:competence protein ComEC
VTTNLQIAGATVGPTDSTLTVRNSGTTIADLAGWELRVGSERATLPSSATVLPGQSLTIHTGTGTDTATDVYLGTRASTLASGFRAGAQVVLVDPVGRPLVQFTIP